MLYIDSVKGIDNDLAFGLMTSKQINAGQTGQNLDAIIATNSAPINGGEAVQTVKYITEDFYNSILDYDDKLIEYDQLDIRSKEEIEALKDRIHGIRQTIKILVAAGKLRIVKTPQQMREAYEESRDYYGGFAAKTGQWAYNLASEHMLKAIR